MLKHWARSSILAIAAFVCCIGALLGTASLMAANPERVDAARSDLARALGVDITVAGPVAVEILPRPRLIARDVQVSGLDHTVKVDVPVFRGSLSLFSLLQGRISFNKVQLINPTAVVDLGALLPMDRQASGAQVEAGFDQRGVDKVAITSGVIEVRRTNSSDPVLLTDCHGEIEGLADGPVTVSGGASWLGERAELSAHFDSLRALLAAQPTKGGLRLRSRVLSASISGQLSEGLQGGFSGRVSVSTASLSSVLRAFGLSGPSGLAIQRASLAGDAETTPDGIALANARIVFEDSTLEGTLGLQQTSHGTSLAGTLATDVLRLDPFLSILPSVRDDEGRWSRDTLDPSVIAGRDMDLRISANRLLLRGIETEDAALSALSQDGRMELSLGEAKAYGGLVKGRVFANEAGKDVDVKLDASWTRVKLDQIGALLGAGPGRISGYGTGHLTLGGHGRSVDDIVRTAAGHGQISLRQGRLSVPIIEALTHPSAPTTASAETADVPVDLAFADFQVAQGLLTLASARVAGTDFRYDISGKSSLAMQNYVLTSTAVSDRDGVADFAPSPAVMFAGRWGEPVQRLEPDKTKLGEAPSTFDATGTGYFP